MILMRSSLHASTSCASEAPGSQAVRPTRNLNLGIALMLSMIMLTFSSSISALTRSVSIFTTM